MYHTRKATISMKILVLTLLLLLGTRWNPVSGQDTILSYGVPSEVAMDVKMLEAGVDLFRRAVNDDSLRSVVLLVARQGKVVLHQAFGWRDKETQAPIRRDAMFRMASNTKPVVSTAINILVDEGMMELSDSVFSYLDAFDNRRSREVTVHHLLTHTSGFRIRPIFFQPLIQPSPEHPEAPSLQLEVDRFGEVGPTEPPGESYSYNNAGYNTLGALIEVVSGQPLEVFLKQRIYVPLGMIDTYHHEVEEKLDGKLDRMSVVYYQRDGKWIEGWRPGDPPQYPFVRASGGMISTAWDYAIFCQMYLNGGRYNGHQILKEETIERIVTPHTASLYSREDLEKQTSFYGYGWSVDRNGVFSHGGSDGTSAWIDPASELIVLVFTQSPDRINLANRFFKLVLQSIES